MEGPDPMEVPPQLPVNHCQEAPVPKAPPLTLRLVELPMHTGFTVADMEEGAVELVFTFTVSEAQLVVLQVPEASA